MFYNTIIGSQKESDEIWISRSRKTEAEQIYYWLLLKLLL